MSFFLKKLKHHDPLINPSKDSLLLAQNPNGSKAGIVSFENMVEKSGRGINPEDYEVGQILKIVMKEDKKNLEGVNITLLNADDYESGEVIAVAEENGQKVFVGVKLPESVEIKHARFIVNADGDAIADYNTTGEQIQIQRNDVGTYSYTGGNVLISSIIPIGAHETDRRTFYFNDKTWDSIQFFDYGGEPADTQFIIYFISL